MASGRKTLPKDQCCPICHEYFSIKGINRHLSSCQKRIPTGKGQAQFTDIADKLRSQELMRREAIATAVLQSDTVNEISENSPFFQPPSLLSELADLGHVNTIDPASNQPFTSPHDSNEPTMSRPSILTLLDTMLDLGTLEQEQIRIEFHSSAGKPTETKPAAQYNPHNANNSEHLPKLATNAPWHPFRSRLDFEVAELALSTHMNRQQKTILINLIEKCIANPKEFTISNTQELDMTWELARSYRSAGFQKQEYTVPYKKDEIQYEVFVRPLIDWCSELLRNPLVLPHFHWHAERHYRMDRIKSERLFGEPWTANEWWNIQNLLPPGALPFFIILYADKTHLSTFGTAKAYPVLARCANLSAGLRNGSGVEGGRLVGWLPIVEEDAGQTGKKIFVNFKRIVWHKGFYEILKSIQEYSDSGCHIKCADGIVRWLFFFILILSADYEEQCVMALTRGATSNFPCPICLVPRDELCNLIDKYPLRTSEEMREVYLASQRLNSKDRENYLKDYGLRNVENVFWMMNGSDVYKALSWDRLHAYHGGLFSDHLWAEFKNILEGSDYERKDAELVDRQFDLVPRWSGLNHFTSVIKTGEFADGSKYEDMAKIIVFASHNVLQKTERGYCLLKLIRCFLELDMYSSLTIHSDTTLKGLEKELYTFNNILKEYITIYPDKNWNFPKNHTHAHMVHDIMAKGATRNSNTKPNEKAHGLLKLWYRFHTNFKDTAPQILKMNEDDMVSMIIRLEISAIDESEARKEEDEDTLHQPDPARKSLTLENVLTNNISIGSLLKPISFEDFEAEHQGDPAFHRFRIKTGIYLTSVSTVAIRLSGPDMITPFQLAKIQYKSIVDWSIQRDLLRVSPSFHKRPRNDYVLIKTHDLQSFCFAQLLAMFTVTVPGDAVHKLALVLPFDENIDRRTLLSRKRDKDLQFRRVRSRQRLGSVVVSLQNIIRGGLLVSDYGNNPDEFIVVDVADPDMWWLLKSLSLSTHVKL